MVKSKFTEVAPREKRSPKVELPGMVSGMLHVETEVGTDEPSKIQRHASCENQAPFVCQIKTLRAIPARARVPCKSHLFLHSGHPRRGVMLLVTTLS